MAKMDWEKAKRKSQQAASKEYVPEEKIKHFEVVLLSPEDIEAREREKQQWYENNANLVKQLLLDQQQLMEQYQRDLLKQPGTQYRERVKESKNQQAVRQQRAAENKQRKKERQDRGDARRALEAIKRNERYRKSKEEAKQVSQKLKSTAKPKHKPESVTDKQKHICNIAQKCLVKMQADPMNAGVDVSILWAAALKWAHKRVYK